MLTVAGRAPERWGLGRCLLGLGAAFAAEEVFAAFLLLIGRLLTVPFGLTLVVLDGRTWLGGALGLELFEDVFQVDGDLSLLLWLEGLGRSQGLA